MKKIMEILGSQKSYEEKFKDICLDLFHMKVDIYSMKHSNIITYEIHFPDDNYYEVDVIKDMSLENLYIEIKTNVVSEREIDLKHPEINRNNERYVKKYFNIL